MNGQLHAPATLTSAKKNWTFPRREKYLVLAGNQTLYENKKKTDHYEVPML